MNIWNKWKQKWNIQSDKRMIWIFIIFAITGSSTLVVRKYLYSTLGIEIENSIISFLVRLIFIYVIYQFLFFAIASIMGEHQFAKWFLRKMNKRILPFIK
jgi:type III secretory pathway component EscU